jgi:hypothetical protein
VSTAAETIRRVEQAGARSTHHPWLQRARRLGYAARGAVYTTIGLLALRLSLGAGGKTTDSRGAIATLGQAPFGKVLVLALAVGLVGLSIWMLADAVGDPQGTRRSGFFAGASRLGEAIAGLAHVALAFAAVRLALGGGAARSGDAAAQSWTARALELPAGRWIVLLAATIVVIVGARRIWGALRRSFLEHLDLSDARPGVRRWAPRLGAAGLTAQGAVFVLVGLFFAVAAMRGDAREATGFDGALAAVARQPSGMALLGALALGLLAYAAFSVIEARHPRVARP